MCSQIHSHCSKDVESTLNVKKIVWKIFGIIRKQTISSILYNTCLVSFTCHCMTVKCYLLLTILVKLTISWMAQESQKYIRKPRKRNSRGRELKVVSWWQRSLAYPPVLLDFHKYEPCPSSEAHGRVMREKLHFQNHPPRRKQHYVTS